MKLKLLEKIRTENRMWHKGQLSDYARELGYSAENAGRRLRELEESGLIKRKLNDKNMVMYYLRNDIFMDMGITDKPTKPQFGSKSDIYKLRFNKF